MGVADFVTCTRTATTLAEARAVSSATPKHAIPLRVDEKQAADKEDARKLAVWRTQVFALDKHTCRCCSVKVKRTLSLVPDRAESHHVAGRDDQAVRVDIRNGLTLCYRCHRRVTGIVADKLTIVGTVFFRIGGQRYINARKPVTFKGAA